MPGWSAGGTLLLGTVHISIAMWDAVPQLIHLRAQAKAALLLQWPRTNRYVRRRCFELAIIGFLVSFAWNSSQQRPVSGVKAPEALQALLQWHGIQPRATNAVAL